MNKLDKKSNFDRETNNMKYLCVLCIVACLHIVRCEALELEAGGVDGPALGHDRAVSQQNRHTAVVNRESGEQNRWAQPA